MPTKSALKNPNLTPSKGEEDEKLTPKKSSREVVYSILGEDDGFHAHLVVPDVLERAPPEQLPVAYGDGNSIEMGNLLTPEDLRYKPVIDLEKTDPGRFYCLVMTDPDVPNRAMPTERELLHWLVVNITDRNIAKGEEIVPYKPPLPNMGSGLHRYVFVLLEQTRPITIATEAEKAALLEKSLKSKLQKTSESKDPKKSSTFLDLETKSKSTVRPSSSTKTSSGSNGTKVKDEKEKLLGSSTSEKIPLIECVKFSTKEFTKKYAISGVFAANFLQTEYNEYVGRQLEAEKKGLLEEEKKLEKVKQVMKIDEKKTIDSIKNLKIKK
ncbi:hypothetical protein FO519_002424 [Halicephalobus sp. NKZ332]|nr:hypothetical protein FO519_002424 [Halicephalobus sp. NKZ332]